MKGKIQKGIQIDPRHRGSFTAFAQSLGMSVQQAAAHVLAHRDQFPPERVQQANFARNAAKFKHQDGGITGAASLTGQPENDVPGPPGAGYVRNNFFNRLFNRNNILEQQIRNEYGALKQIPLRKLHVDYADDADAETLKQLQRKVEFIGPEEGTRQVQVGSITIPKGKMLVDDNPSNPKFISVRHPGQYTTVLDPEGKSAREIKAEVANDFVSHALHNDPVYDQLNRQLENLLVRQYGESDVRNNGGADAYIRALISDDKEYQPYLEEMSFVPQALKDKIVNYITTGKAPRFQKGGIGNVSIRGYKSDSPDRFNAFNIIPSNHITMQDVPHPVWGVDDTGASQLMMPGNDYRFPGRAVFEVPVYPEATVPFEKIEKNYKQNGGPINMSKSRKPIPRRRARYNSNAYMQSGGEPGYPMFPVGVNYVFPGQEALSYSDSFQTGGQPGMVNQVPAGYHPATTGQRAGQYQQFIIRQLGSGVTPEQLAQRRYISPSQVEKYRQYYKPSPDSAHTQPIPPQSTPPEDLYSPDNHIRFQTGGEQPRLVDTVPSDYYPYGQYQGRPTFAKDSGVTMPLATGHGSGGAQYEQFLRKKLASGVSPEELAQKRYIHPSQMERFRQYYKPSRDVVYTQPPVPPQPSTPEDNPGQGFEGTYLFDPRQHATAAVRYRSRNSAGQADPGMLNTSQQVAQLMFLDQMGHPDPSKGLYEVPADVFSNQMTGGTHTLRDTSGISQYRVPLGQLGSRFQTGGQPRLVNTVPTDYRQEGQYQGRPTWVKDMGANLPAATGSGQGGAQYEQFLIKQLASGVTPEQLAQKRYIDASQLEKYRQYYKPNRDVVYTQPTTPPPTPPDYRSQGYFNEDLYFPNKRLAAFARNRDRYSRGQSDPGTLNSAMQPVELMFSDNMGRPDPSKGQYFIPHDVYSNQMTHGTNVLQDTTGLSQYRVPPPGQLSSRFQLGGGYNPFFFRYL